ncbi:AraC family transcriptional regulator [Xinfangfangia sp. D13-10-4-6]|uniref:AraC family transcriptional regulator n=1 Tax=Pseudogemmobacter hezensis TaxID=2737662 RepID=UPI00155683F1|nr:AraC family transcriptional regulator [Pseudogemmobacter hezensis]NPD17141.1 AraC family transcriptional regulator [Pseudogemmobacter hezensis]
MSANQYHHLSWHHGIELFEAAFSTQTFSRHAHAGFAIGAIAEGAGGYVCRGESMVLPAGSLSLMNPEEPHTGHAAAGRVRYNMLYVSEAAVREVLGLRDLRGFSEIAPQDRGFQLMRALDGLARQLNGQTGPDWRMGVEEAVHEALAGAFARHGRAELRPPGQEPRALAVLRERITAGVEAGESLTLDDLAAEAGLHPSYLVRSIARATGMTPHAHVIHYRVVYARRLLLGGVPAAEAAIAAGFCDQPHLIRQFRRHYGVTPGALIRH